MYNKMLLLEMSEKATLFKRVLYMYFIDFNHVCFVLHWPIFTYLYAGVYLHMDITGLLKCAIMCMHASIETVQLQVHNGGHTQPTCTCTGISWRLKLLTSASG